jgi:protein-tyrosine phosphatase
MSDDPPEKARDDAPQPQEAARRIDRVNDWLFVGGAIPAEEQYRLTEAGIGQVIDLREEVTADVGNLVGLGIGHHHVPVPNHHAPTAAQLDEVAGLIEAIRSKRPVYVHCAGGFGRATTMAVALLVRDGVPVDEAIGRVKRARPEMVLNDEQLGWLRGLAPRRRQ